MPQGLMWVGLQKGARKERRKKKREMPARARKRWSGHVDWECMGMAWQHGMAFASGPLT